MCRKLVALVLVLAFVGSASAGLVARYTFDDGTANNQGGSAGAPANGSFEGAAGIVADPGGGLFPWNPDKEPSLVLETQGYGNYVNCGGGGGGWGDLAGDGIVTLMTWYKPNGWNGNYSTFVANGTGENNGWSLNTYGGGGDVAFLSGNCPDWLGVPTGNADALDGSWHHLTGVFLPEGAHPDYGFGYIPGTSWVYLDGVFANTATRWLPVQLGLLDVMLGQEPSQIASGSGYRGWNGWLDDIRIYDEYKTAAEVYDCYVEGLIPEPATIALLGLGGLALLRKKR